MSRRLVVEPEAEAEISDVASWYEHNNPAARSAFLLAIDRTVRLIQDHPKQYQIVYREARRALVHGFPYVFLYKVTDNEIIIAALFHTSRNPKLWRARLR